MQDRVGAGRSRAALACGALVLVAVAAGVSLLGAHDTANRVVDAGTDVSPLSGVELACTMEDPRAQAAVLEQLAEARFQRAPFDDTEAPLAVIQMTRAEHCYRRAGDLAATLRAETRRVQLERYLERRFEGERLALELARRAERAPAVQRHAHALLTLLAQADGRADAYRALLTELERAAFATVVAERALEQP